MQFTALGQVVFDGSEVPVQKVPALTPGTTVAANLTGVATATLTPAQNCTVNASGGVNNQVVVLIITTSGTNSYTVTFGTNFRAAGTLTTGTVSAKAFVLKFINVNGVWYEISRTAAL